MITKERFIKTIECIREQEKIDDEIAGALSKVCDGLVSYGINNKEYYALRELLEDVCNDIYGYIGWWLYETTDYRIWYKDENGKEIERKIETVEDLYDYILECQDEWIAAKNEKK